MIDRKAWHATDHGSQRTGHDWWLYWADFTGDKIKKQKGDKMYKKIFNFLLLK